MVIQGHETAQVIRHYVVRQVNEMVGFICRIEVGTLPLLELYKGGGANGDSSGTVKNDLDTTVGLWSAWGRGFLSLAHSFRKDYLSTHAMIRPTLEAFFEPATENKQHLNSNYDRIRYARSKMQFQPPTLELSHAQNIG
jgi:hypothetical protein